MKAMKNLLRIVLRHVLGTALLISVHQFSHAGLLGNSFTLTRITAYELDGKSTVAPPSTDTFTAGSEAHLPEDISVYENRIDFRPQPYPIPIGATLKSSQYLLYNLTQDFLDIQVNSEKTTFANWGTQIVTLEGKNAFSINFFGLPVDGTAILALDIRTASDATAVPEPNAVSLTLIGALMWLLAMSGTRRSWPAIWITVKGVVPILALAYQRLGKTVAPWIWHDKGRSCS